MVYQGKPSAGCANCRKRKIKCDEVTPACNQCLNTKRTCPGYVARFDLILRDQTKAVRRKAQRRKETESTTSPSKKAATIQRRSSGDSLSSESSTHAFNGSGDWVLIKKRSCSPDKSLPRIFNDFPEQQAICAFFLDFVLSPRHPDSVRGHLEHLAPMYQRASPESPLALATSSVALAMSGNSNAKPADQQLGKTTFGKALRKTSTAIRDPIQSIKDETLMAVLLLGLYERINATTTTSSLSLASTHNAGAAALVKHRGPANCTTPLAIGLLFAVRTQLVEHAIELGQAFERCPDKLSAIFKNLPQNASARLTSATTNIADLRACAKSALAAPRSPAADKEVVDLLEYAISIDLLVAAWSQSVPANWGWRRAAGFATPPFQPRGAYAYSHPSSLSAASASSDEAAPVSVEERIDTYLDLWVLSIWNQYRAARLKIQAIILACIAYLGPEQEGEWYWRKVYATMVAQEMTDDICASVPFALGTKTLGGEREGVVFPEPAQSGLDRGSAYATSTPPSSSMNVEGGAASSSAAAAAAVKAMPPHQSTSPEHKRAAAAMGGWHLLDPLRAVLGLEMGVLREGQGEWVVGQMERVGRIYGGGNGRGMWERGSWEFPV